MIGKILCLLGMHKWKQHPSQWHKTGFAITHSMIFVGHEIEIEHSCQRCGRRAAWGGYTPDSLTKHMHPGEFPMRKDGRWPIDANGNQLPLSGDSGRKHSPFRYIESPDRALSKGTGQ